MWTQLFLCELKLQQLVLRLLSSSKAVSMLKVCFLSMTDAPLQNSSGEVMAVYNQSVVIVECDVCANPEPAYGSYTWIVNGAVIPAEVNCESLHSTFFDIFKCYFCNSTSICHNSCFRPADTWNSTTSLMTISRPTDAVCLTTLAVNRALTLS